MKKNQTTEITTDSLAAFHPYDYRSTILASYYSRLQRYGI